MSDTKLKPCPFCGGEAKHIKRTNEHPHVHAVWCENCNCRTSFGQSEKEVMRKWNTRKPMERIVEQLESEKRIAFLTLANAQDIPDMVYEKVSQHLDKAIEIVEGGAE